MKKMTCAELRSVFLDFFRERRHEIVPSSPLVPVNDPTLLFTNAGMVQFKDIFLGREKAPYARAATTQRCVRAGGKHNDLENVGYTARHHTFFEMLGNFSFGDYFKRDAIHYAWELLTGVLGIPQQRLWVTVFDEDKEAETIWLQEVGIDPKRFARIGGEDNFWSMGEVGPCGPCSEIFYDHGEGIAGGPPGSPEAEGDRFVEIWNLVFMQYDRAKDGTLTPLPKPSVDTGMGLERLAAVMQGVHNNYEIDLFQNLVKCAADLAGTTDLSQSSLRVVADHIRSAAFLIVDGVLPANEGRGYVLRRIIRRALRHGYRLGIREIFFYKLVEPLCNEMGDAFAELPQARDQVERILRKEEERFAETLEQGMKLLESCVTKLEGSEIPGETVFQLYDTYGFPVDLTADFAREHQLTIDLQGFEGAMQAQRDRARAASHFGADYAGEIHLDTETEFTGYRYLAQQARIVALIQDGVSVMHMDEGAEGTVILDKTPFYAESGGQVGDVGVIQSETALFEVTDTQKQALSVYLHKGRLIRGTLTVKQPCEAVVNGEMRQATALNHSATHLLHAALRRVLGEHVMQKGSLVDAQRLRFDFSHFDPVATQEIAAIERLVNEQIRHNSQVTAEVMKKEEAMAAGAVALFGEKYGDEVRVLRIGAFSTELCGGTHVRHAGDIGFFKIISETGVAAGTRRIEAITGEAAVAWVQRADRLLHTLADRLKCSRDKVEEKVRHLLDNNRTLEKELDRVKSKLASSEGSDLSRNAVDLDGLKVLAVQLEDADPKALRAMVDQLKNKLGSAAIVLATVRGDKVSLVAGVTKDRVASIRAGDLVNHVATQVGGKGGGRPDMAQAGGNDPAALDAALGSVADWVRERVI